MVIHRKSDSKKTECGDECGPVKKQLCHTLIENQKLRSALENAEHGKGRKEVVVKDEDLENQLAATLAEVERLRKVAAVHKQCRTEIIVHKSYHSLKTQPRTPSPDPSKISTSSLVRKREVVNLYKSEDPKFSSEIQSIVYQQPKVASRREVTKTETQSSIKTYGEPQLEELPPEPEEQPTLVVVSKHEFDEIHQQKKNLYTESREPFDGEEILNCNLEISMYDLEMNREMKEYISAIEDDPRVFLHWSFLGLDQRTDSIPPEDAFFNTQVTYFGPLTQTMTDHVKQNVMPVHLVLAKGETRGKRIGTGELDLFPAISNPGKGFFRSVDITGVKGSACVACSFRMHGCCAGEKPGEDTIEVAIGRLKLNNPDEIPDKNTHLYVEYSLLGRCGAELETDSLPKSDLMRFNYARRLNVHDHNVASLEPLIQRDTPKPLKFFVLSEPCSLSAPGSEVEEVGTAEVNLREEMIQKDKDILSAQLPVTNKDGDELGSLSVTIIGVDTLLHHTEEKNQQNKKKAEKKR